MVSGRAFRFAFALVSACTAAASGAHDGRDVYTSAYLDLTAAGFSWRDEWGMFGEGHVSAAAGVLLAAPGGGCSLPLLPRDTLPPPPGTHWIALVPRGGCDFQVKVNNAALSEAAGIIVFDDRDSSTLEKMKLSPGECPIY
ncbi:hypothetical protein AAG570_012539 [Ranatra chinensis]|uniref:PA domain-containing protein n=1 Tax=Ranatra chinensis TaxID=642074 RepID=A0ABD0YES7_9HEMI